MGFGGERLAAARPLAASKSLVLVSSSSSGAESSFVSRCEVPTTSVTLLGGAEAREAHHCRHLVVFLKVHVILRPALPLLLLLLLVGLGFLLLKSQPPWVESTPPRSKPSRTPAPPHLLPQLLHALLKVVLLLLLLQLLLVDLKAFLDLIQGGALHPHGHAQVPLVCTHKRPRLARLAFAPAPAGLKLTLLSVDVIQEVDGVFHDAVADVAVIPEGRGHRQE